MVWLVGNIYWPCEQDIHNLGTLCGEGVKFFVQFLSEMEDIHRPKCYQKSIITQNNQIKRCSTSVVLCLSKLRIERTWIKKQIRQNSYRWSARANQEKKYTQKQRAFSQREKLESYIDRITNNNLFIIYKNTWTFNLLFIHIYVLVLFFCTIIFNWYYYRVFVIV